MEKMNQVSVTEFMSKSKEEMYDMAVEMVEKYNRLVDICNDSAERMAELMAKDDINEFKKELQSREPGELKIQKLADIVVWADNWIKELKDGLTEEEFTEYIEDGEVRDFETVKKVVLESMERHTVYSNALNMDIAAKDAKIELMQKELDGRKAGYAALKARFDSKNDEIEKLKKSFNALKEEMATRYITIETHNSICETYDNKVAELEKELADCKVKIRHQKENLDGINKTLEIRTKENERLIVVKNNQKKEIEAHESENARLTEKIMELKKERDKHMARVNDLRMELDCVKASKEKHEEAAHDKVVEDLRESFNYWRTQCLAAQEERDSSNKDAKYWEEAFGAQSVELADKVKENTYLKKELEETCRTKELDLKGHQRREVSLVNALADKNEEIKSLKEENSYLKSEIKQKQNIIKKAYERYSDEVIKTRKDVLEVAYRDIEKDNGYVGFKLYVKSALIEAKGDKNEANEIITEAVRSAYTEWDKTQKENEKTIKKAIKEMKSKRGTPDIPCGEDAIE